jgi:hypothetical protein
MRRLIPMLIWAALLYSGYWVAASQLLRTGPDRAVAVLAQEGVALDFGSVTTSGFPARFDTQITDLRLVHADWSWQGKALDLQADSYRPLAVNLIFPQEQTLTIAGQTLRIISQDWQAEAAVRPTAMLSFDRGRVAMGHTEVMSSDGWTLGLADLTASLAHAGGGAATYDADLAARQVDLPAALRDRIDPRGVLGPQVRAITGAARLTLARPLDRDLQGRLPDVDQVILQDLRLDWGPVTAQMSGEIAIDATGLPTGQFMLRTRQWQQVVDVLISAGVIDAAMSTTITRLAGYMADADGMLTVPVAFQDGVTLVGLVPVGPAPRLR